MDYIKRLFEKMESMAPGTCIIKFERDVTMDNRPRFKMEWTILPQYDDDFIKHNDFEFTRGENQN